MNRPSLAFASIVLLSSSLLSGCATAPAGRCDTSQSVGSCAVTVQMQGSRLVLCPVKEDAATPMCMKPTVDVTRAGRTQSTHFMMEPGRCQPLGTDITSAAVASCEAFAMRPRDAQLTAKE